MKLCPKCERYKARDDFSRHSSRADGLQYSCRECCKRQKKMDRMANGIKLSDASLRYQKAYRNLWRYGISSCDFTRMRISQMDRCAICGVDEKLNIDHCHETGTVRGLLCGGCNRGLGQFGDSLERMRSAVSYMERFLSS